MALEQPLLGPHYMEASYPAKRVTAICPWSICLTAPCQLSLWEETGEPGENPVTWGLCSSHIEKVPHWESNSGPKRWKASILTTSPPNEVRTRIEKWRGRGEGYPTLNYLPPSPLPHVYIQAQFELACSANGLTLYQMSYRLSSLLGESTSSNLYAYEIFSWLIKLSIVIAMTTVSW